VLRHAGGAESVELIQESKLRLQVGHPGDCGSSSGKGKKFNIFQISQVDTGTYPVSYPMGKGDSASQV